MLTLKDIQIKAFKGLGVVQISDLGRVNALVGKNNSGKSTILHAIEMASLALVVRRWDQFYLKLDIADMFANLGDFEILLTYSDTSKVTIKSDPQRPAPNVNPDATEIQKLKSILVVPDSGSNLLNRQHRTPRTVIDAVNAKNFAHLNAMDILYAIRFFASRGEQGFTMNDYNSLITEIKTYFPDIEDVESGRTEHDISTLTYTEFGKKLDILYSGSGLKHFLDVLIKTTLSGAKILLLDEPEMGLHPDLQRRFTEYLLKLATDKNLQVFIATHSPVLLNYTNEIQCYRIQNTKGNRTATRVPREASHLLLSDLGIRPSDIFNQDICLMVEGQSEVIFFEHIVRELYKDDLKGIAVGVVQYGGDAASAIVDGSIELTNITASQKYTYWIHDRDNSPTNAPSRPAQRLVRTLCEAGMKTHIFKKREVEFYYPLSVHLAAQDGDKSKEAATQAIYEGDQSVKYKNAATTFGVCVPRGNTLKRLLKENLKSKDHLDPEIREIFDTTLLPWKCEILGVTEPSPNSPA